MLVCANAVIANTKLTTLLLVYETNLRIERYLRIKLMFSVVQYSTVSLTMSIVRLRALQASIVNDLQYVQIGIGIGNNNIHCTVLLVVIVANTKSTTRYKY